MTTDLEQQFYTTFGIEPKNRFKGCKLGVKYYAEICDEPTCNGCDDEIRETEYPQITDRILLELICILTRWHLDKHEPYEIMSINMEQLKNQILSNCLYIAKYQMARHQVQALFKEER